MNHNATPRSSFHRNRIKVITSLTAWSSKSNVTQRLWKRRKDLPVTNKNLFRVSTRHLWRILIQVFYVGSYTNDIIPLTLARNQEDRFKTKYGTFIITNHWFSNRLFPFRARKNSIRKNKHRQQRNVNETESLLHWFFRDWNFDIRRDEDIQNLDHTITLLDIIHAFCHRCALSYGSLTTDPRTIRREILFPVAVDKRTCSFLLRMEFMYQAVDAHVYNYVHDTSRPIYRTRERRLRFWPAL